MQRRKGAKAQTSRGAKAKNRQSFVQRENEKTLAGTLARSAPIYGEQERVVHVVIVATRTPTETHI